MKEISHISPSLLNSFNTCPLRFKYGSEDLAKIEVDTDRLEYGLEIHKKIQDYMNKVRNDISPKEIEGLCRQTFGEGSKFVRKDVAEKVKQNFLDFEIRRKERFKVFKPTMTEEKLGAHLFKDLPPFVCIVDAYWKEDKTCINWKTGSGVQIEDYHLIQGKIEKMILESWGFPVERYWFVCLGNGKTLELPSITDGWIKNKCDELMSCIKNDLFQKRQSKLCEWCESQLRCSFDGDCLWLI